jgi:hypothetical protein
MDQHVQALVEVGVTEPRRGKQRGAQPRALQQGAPAQPLLLGSTHRGFGAARAERRPAPLRA